MHVLGSWRVLCVLGLAVASLRMDEAELDGNYADDYDNEISRDQREGEFGSFVPLSLFGSCLFEQMFSISMPNTYLFIFFSVFFD